ncbi:hypothetical protein [Nocardia jinanensis]|uniref:hypothetical protein n=1 Tax=Nocardia jinanensis TaxID=382504 RepID=UPI001E658B7E|nr:hypothetical protein [Nocardia jinanensis]
MIETGNAFINTVPVLFILVMMTWQVVPAPALGVTMSVVFYQIFHGTITHFSAALMRRYEPSSQGERSRVFDFGANVPWIAFPAAGIAVGVHLIVTGDYSFALW